jgi:cellulase
MTKAYSATDPGVLCNIYNGLTTYEIPGPAVWDGASSGTSPASTTPTATAAPVSSAAPSKTVTPVTSAVASPVATPVEDAEPSTTPVPTSGSGSGSALPETFTIEQFISWLKSTTGSSAKRLRRAHARAFQL